MSYTLAELSGGGSMRLFLFLLIFVLSGINAKADCYEEAKYYLSFESGPLTRSGYIIEGALHALYSCAKDDLGIDESPATLREDGDFSPEYDLEESITKIPGNWGGITETYPTSSQGN